MSILELETILKERKISYRKNCKELTLINKILKSYN